MRSLQPLFTLSTDEEGDEVQKLGVLSKRVTWEMRVRLPALPER